MIMRKYRGSICRVAVLLRVCWWYPFEGLGGGPHITTIGFSSTLIAFIGLVGSGVVRATQEGIYPTSSRDRDFFIFLTPPSLFYQGTQFTIMSRS